MPDVERLRDNPGRATGRTTQSQTPPQDCLDLFKIYFQGLYISYLLKEEYSRGGAAAQRRAAAPLREKLSYGFSPLTTR